MRLALILSCVALAACGQPDEDKTYEPGARQQPSVTTPGVHMSGYAQVGVKKGF